MSVLGNIGSYYSVSNIDKHHAGILALCYVLMAVSHYIGETTIGITSVGLLYFVVAFIYRREEYILALLYVGVALFHIRHVFDPFMSV